MLNYCWSNYISAVNKAALKCVEKLRETAEDIYMQS